MNRKKNAAAVTVGDSLLELPFLGQKSIVGVGLRPNDKV